MNSDSFKSDENVTQGIKIKLNLKVGKETPNSGQKKRGRPKKEKSPKQIKPRGRPPKDPEKRAEKQKQLDRERGIFSPNQSLETPSPKDKKVLTFEVIGSKLYFSGWQKGSLTKTYEAYTVASFDFRVVRVIVIGRGTATKISSTATAQNLRFIISYNVCAISYTFQINRKHRQKSYRNQ